MTAKKTVPTQVDKAARGAGPDRIRRRERRKLLTPKENAQDTTAHGRRKPGRFSRAEVTDIARRLRNGEIGRDLAIEFGVDKAIISRIKHGKRRWAVAI